jgi:phage N-6-adenine-methyltransferase
MDRHWRQNLLREVQVMPSNQDMRTPPWLFHLLDGLFGPFNLDAAASKKDALCIAYHTEGDDGLEQPWRDRTFVNPPWKMFWKWIAKAHREWIAHQRRSVSLGPALGSQNWARAYAPYARVLVPDMRIHYLLPDGRPTHHARDDTMVYVFGFGGAVNTIELEVLPVRHIQKQFLAQARDLD